MPQLISAAKSLLICEMKTTKTNTQELFDRYKIMVTENSCSIYDKRYSRVIVNQFNNPYHILSTNTKGNRYYLYFRRDEFDKNMCLFIDRKICRGYTQPRVIYTNFKMDNDIFDGTLIHGELVKVNENDWFFILNDIVSYCGKSLKHTKKLDRIRYMYKFLKKQYSSDDILDVCKFQVKKFFTYRQLDEFMNYVKTLPYQVNGILFNSLNPSKMYILLLHNMETAFKFTKQRNNNNIQKEKIVSNNTMEIQNTENAENVENTESTNIEKVSQIESQIESQIKSQIKSKLNLKLNLQ